MEWEDVPAARKCRKHSVASQTPLRSADEKWNCSAFLKNVKLPSNTISKETGNLRFFPMPITPHPNIAYIIFHCKQRISKQTYLKPSRFQRTIIKNPVTNLQSSWNTETWILLGTSRQLLTTQAKRSAHCKCSQRMRSAQVQYHGKSWNVFSSSNQRSIKKWHNSFVLLYYFSALKTRAEKTKPMPLGSARQVTEGDDNKCYEDYQCYQESK